VLRHPDYTRSRLWKVAEQIFARIYLAKRPVDELLVSPPVGRIPWAEAQRLNYRPAKVGEQFGPLWTTFWFKAKAKVPPEWEGKRVDLLWNSHSEATLWTKGRILQGLNHEPNRLGKPCRADAVLVERANGKETVEFHIEMACNGLFGSTSAKPYSSISPFILDQCDIALFDAQAWNLYYDFMVLQELEAEQHRSDLDKTWGGELLSELNRFANIVNPEDPKTWPEGQEILKKLYTRHNATQAHELSAIGHAHIDTAWLWPLAETWRKCERTFSSQLAYMDLYPEYKFACSQACQFAAMKQRNPDLYQRIKDKVKKGQFVPVGGTWVEPDCNIPSGEAMARQFLHGQRLFQQEFGITCREFWNPDVFGYNGQLPQLMRLSGITRFLTQKLSWNRFNKPHHHTFNWQGIDGSDVLAHFPPADTYNAMANVVELRRNAREYKDHDRSRHSLLLFGFGDGGGGPTKEMIEMLQRAKDVQGVPRTNMRSSDDFFTLLEKDCTDRATIIGELYFEYHRGTYTTQAATKRNNRKNEFLLHDVEFLASCAQRSAKALYPAGELDRLWKLLLLNQFHDILPGSSITAVYQDTSKDHAEIAASAGKLRDQALASLVPAQGNQQTFAPVNTIGFERREVSVQPDGALAFVEAPAYGIGKTIPPPDRVTSQKTSAGNVVLENAQLKAELNPQGRLVSLIEKQTGRETMAGPGNLFQLYDDATGDAWDVDPFHLETAQDCEPAKFLGVRQDSLRAEVSYEGRIGQHSSMKQFVRLDAGARRLEFHTMVDWRESKKMLKVGFPVVVRAMNATYEMQFGNVERATHYNTPYDLAKYEVPGHKWVDLSEHGFGAALLSESKYGYSTFGNTMRISLLRAPKHPDPVADIGEHSFAYALMPHAGGWRESGVVGESFRFNVPLLWAKGAPQQPRSFVCCNDANLVLDTVKRAEDSDALVLRLYEAHGARGTAKVKCTWPVTSARFCNILEQDGEAAKIEDGQIVVPYLPYQIVSVKVT
jgi:alpha-mannosidase